MLVPAAGGGADGDDADGALALHDRGRHREDHLPRRVGARLDHRPLGERPRHERLGGVEPGLPGVEMVVVPATPDAADDWIAERIGAADVCVTADIPLAARCLAAGAQAVSPTGHRWTDANIGNALAGRAVSQHLREIGAASGGPAAMTKADRSRFLSELDAACAAARRPPRPRAPAASSRRAASCCSQACAKRWAASPVHCAVARAVPARPTSTAWSSATAACDHA